MTSLTIVNSAEAFPEEFDLFQTPATNTTCERIQYVKYRPKTHFNGDTPLDFTIPASGGQYVCLERTFLSLKMKIFKGDGTEVQLSNYVAPLNLSLHSAFQRIEVFFNQKLVSGGDVLHPYKSYLETLLDYGKEAKQGQLAAAGFYKDTAVWMDTFTGDVENDTASNAGYKRRHLLTTDGKTWQLQGPILADICQQERYILNQVEIAIKLYPHRKEFFLLSDDVDSGYTYKITDAYLQVCLVLPQPWLIIAHKQALEKSNAIYPYIRTDMRTLSVANGAYGFQLEDVYQGLVPKELVIAMVTSRAYNGSYNTNAYNFKHFDITSLSVSIDGLPSPTQPLQFNFSGKGNDYMDGYMSLGV